ncbi:MAG: sulfatase, partial [Bacteroidota bacterium]
MLRSIYLLLLLIFASLSCKETATEKLSPQPNILFCIADDWSYPHAGAYGDKIVRTPNFDRIAKEGYLFMNAFTASPSCSPSRASILSGQEMWRLEEGGLLFGALSSKIPVYTHLLKDQGYEIAHTGKGYGPADLARGGWQENPAGKAYQEIEKEVPEGIRSTDYAANFKAFMEEKDPQKPFCFWYGASEPHRRYGYGNGAKNGYELDQIQLPEFLPDAEETRNDVADYYFEVEWFDHHLGKMIAYLEEEELLENTIIVVTSDNGMPFPRAKSTLYNYGTHMPLAIRWGQTAEKGKIIQNPVSLTDIAPTFLELAHAPIPEKISGKSLAPLLLGEIDEAPRTFVVSGLERHTIARPENKGYPMRAIHTPELTYIFNFEAERWPVGNPDFDAWPQGFYGDVDGGASKTLFMENPSKWEELFELSFGKRPEEELFFRTDDPFQLRNQAYQAEHQALKEELKQQLFEYLKATQDPRMKGISPWDNYPFAGG